MCCLAAVTSPSGLCFLAKWATFFHQPLSLKSTSLKKGGLKNGSGPGDRLADGALDAVGDVMLECDASSLYREGSGESGRDESVASVRASVSADPSPSGGSGDFRKRLAIPDTIMPGWRPRKGESREMVPRMRCLKGYPDRASRDGYPTAFAE